MRKLIDGFLIGFGSALSIILLASWILLLRVLESGYLTVAEADIIEAAQIATIIGTLLGVLLVTAGLSLELAGRKRKMKIVLQAFVLFLAYKVKLVLLDSCGYFL